MNAHIKFFSLSGVIKVKFLCEINTFTCRHISVSLNQYMRKMKQSVGRTTNHRKVGTFSQSEFFLFLSKFSVSG